MTALLLKSFVSSIVKCLKITSNCNRIGIRKANYHITKRNLKIACSDGPAYTTRLALPPDYENVVDFMCEEYYKNEPTVVNIGLAGSEAPACWRQMLYYQVKEGMTIIAVNRDHCIIGAALNCAGFPSDGQRLYEYSMCCEPAPIRRIIEFFAYVAEKSNLWERYCVSRTFEQSSLAVHSEYRGQGIGTRLVEESWLLARDCGYPLFSIECNSKYCARISQNFGWEAVWSIPFGQYVRNGELVFKCVKEPHTICQVFIDHLTYYKTYRPPLAPVKKMKPETK
ncbi:arylalkylamine N-acetyltransferase-like 2 [Andrena cerasifolii]|uniref:arylalkylamine N-acetyltransferase-like 2 n=1 Tax=Andrena cerasifolii TaxID=2819439 RepID=UPI004037A33C